MKRLGLIGGMAWPSTIEYYRMINSEINKRLHKNHSAEIILFSVDFEEIEILQFSGDWDSQNKIMSDLAVKIEKAGADGLLICSNTMHACVEHMKSQISIPILHIADAVGIDLRKNNIKKAGLLGTRFLMESGLYQDILTKKYGIEVITPKGKDAEMVNEIIYDELVKEIIHDNSRKKYVKIIDSLSRIGIEAIILGCTEIPLLISRKDVALPVYNTTLLHAMYGVDFALN